jgi:formate dehydrogenase subunit gamma
MPVAWSEPHAAEIVRRHAGQEGALLPILHDLQATFRCIPPPAVPFVAHALNLTRAEVHGVVTFYRDFRAAPAGRRVLKLCRAEACQAMDGERIGRRILERFGLDWGDTTPDGSLTVEATYCLGLCACAPAALLDDTPIGRLNDASPDDLANEVGA